MTDRTKPPVGAKLADDTVANDTEPTDLQLGTVLAALADPHRRRVVHDLVNDNDGVTRSCTSFGLELSKSTRSHHFKVLREAGLVHQVDMGNRSEVSLRRSELNNRFPGLLDLIGTEDVG